MNEKEKSGFPKFRWVMLVALVAATMSNAVALIGPAPLIGDISKALGISLGEAVSATMGIYALVGSVFCICGGWFLDRFGIAKVYITCLLLMIVSLLLTPVFATDYTSLNILRGIQSIGGGPIMGSAARVAAEWFPSHQRGIVPGFQGVAMGLGVAIGFVLSPWIFQTTGSWAAAVAWMSVVSVFALVIMVIVAFGPKPPQQQNACGEMGAGSDNDLFKLAIKMPATWAAILCVVAQGWMFQEFNDIVPSYIAIPAPVGLGFGPMTAGQFMGTVQIVFIIGAAASGFIVEKIFRGSPKPVSLIACAVFAVSAFALKFEGLVSNTSILLGLLCVAGFFLSMIAPVGITFLAKNYPERITGRLGGIAQGCSMLGGSLGVFVGAATLHITGSYQLPISIVTIAAIIGCLFSLGLNAPKLFCKTDENQSQLKA